MCLMLLMCCRQTLCVLPGMNVMSLRSCCSLWLPQGRKAREKTDGGLRHQGTQGRHRPVGDPADLQCQQCTSWPFPRLQCKWPRDHDHGSFIHSFTLSFSHSRILSVPASVMASTFPHPQCPMLTGPSPLPLDQGSRHQQKRARLPSQLYLTEPCSSVSRLQSQPPNINSRISLPLYFTRAFP